MLLGRYLSRCVYKISKINSECEEVFILLYFLLFLYCCYYNKDYNYSNLSKVYIWVRVYRRDFFFLGKEYMWIVLMLRILERDG